MLKWLQDKTRNKVIRHETYQPVAQQDPRALNSIKETRKDFEAQQEQMQSRAMKAHAADCKDPWTCTKSPCFKWQPDKIVGPVIYGRSVQRQKSPEEIEEVILGNNKTAASIIKYGGLEGVDDGII